MLRSRERAGEFFDNCVVAEIVTSRESEGFWYSCSRHFHPSITPTTVDTILTAIMNASIRSGLAGKRCKVFELVFDRSLL